MGKGKTGVPIIETLIDKLGGGKIQPVYLLFGEDHFEIDNAAKQIEKAALKFVHSDFDREVIGGEKSIDAATISDLASAYPFSDGRKLIIVKHFEFISNKKNLAPLCSDPPDFLILLLIHYGKVSGLSSEPFKTLIDKNFAFEARNPKSHEWISWVIHYANKRGLKITEENARALLEMVGEDKSLLNMQFQKFLDFMTGETEIKFEMISQLASRTKEYTIFNLTDAITANDKAKAISIGYNLLKAGTDLIVINAMLAKYVTVIARSFELTGKNIPDEIAAKELGISKYYYFNCKRARQYFSDKRLNKVSRALLEAEISIKTTSADQYTILSRLISEFF